MATSPDPTDPLAEPLARSCRLNFVEFCRELGRWSGEGGALEERDGVALWATASDFPVSLNGAVRLEPHLHTVLAELDGDVVACAQLVLSHGIGGVYYVATLEAARGRGLGELVTAEVTNRGLELGATSVGLQASPMGEPIYRRMGYRDLYRQAGLVRFGPA